MKGSSKHLPIPLGLAIAVAGLAGGLFLVNKTQQLKLRASSTASPQQVKITNTGSSSFVVTWLTEEKTTGFVSWGENKSLGETGLDYRDKDKNQDTKSTVHYVLVDNLKPQTKYYFKIVSGGKTFDQSGKLYEITTGPTKTPPDNDLASGRILAPDRQPVANALVFLSLANTIPQAAITDSEGHWLIPLSLARTLDLKEYSSYDRSAQIEEITVRAEQGSAVATLTAGNDNPTADIILGQTNNFLNETLPLSPTPTPPAGKTKQSAFTLPVSVPASAGEAELTITSPSENEKVNSQRPEFFGTGPEGVNLKIEIESTQKISSQTSTNQKGEWNWTPQLPLSAGRHTITVFYTDADGIMQKISRSFEVLAVGESDLPSFTATPSAITASPTVTPTSRPITSPTNTPTPKLTRVSVPSTESGSLSPGFGLPTGLLLGIGLGALVVGTILVIF